MGANPPIMPALMASCWLVIVYKHAVGTNGIVIIGGGLAASRTAEQVRKSQFPGPVTLVSDEAHLPYDRPRGRHR